MSFDPTYTKELPLVSERASFPELDDVVFKPTESKPTRKWFFAIGISGTAALIGAICLGYTFYYGICSFILK